MRFFRALYIFWVAIQFGLDEFAFSNRALRGFRGFIRIIFFNRDLSRPRGERLRLALERLGPIFVKFGQVLSTRRDMIPLDIADELALLQDRVAPFSSEIVSKILEQSFEGDTSTIFRDFDLKPVASASVAQVHFGVLMDGREVAVKVLRPDIGFVIKRDIALLDLFAWALASILPDGKRLKPREVIVEFRRHLEDELDLMREAANASQLRRNFKHSNSLVVPEIYWDFCRTNVMVMERMSGIPVGKIDELRANQINLEKLAASGVEIFFTQVFRDGYFHADMHPGNILVQLDGRYVALDFGIMGTLTEVDKNYLAQNFLAFFRRDYRGVAEAHVDAGWVPKDTRIDDFEATIRFICEPIFDKPLKDISFGRLLLNLFRAARRFNVEIQPQLIMLQKTLLNVEGLGRELDPNLDLWKTAKPYLEDWMKEQVGLRGLIKQIKKEAPLWASMLPRLPRLIDAYLSEDLESGREEHQQEIKDLSRKVRLLGLTTAGLALCLMVLALLQR
ncbi:MAG: ubiquinone biosynthesis regulatory protein kinase UbiB [Proteobacteria bacterium]|nr:ubiquinone biosynthesis regulatory protein kinase UbiB [Pseudomonadota bacterium]MDA1331483.1 ubiquinone biosynthesis regulatory protein kinase UbiB [Pseudomonadota bacterium]